MSADSPELLDAFKAAALSVTKLYKTSAAAQSKSRSDGYQDCLDDLLSFLDKENIGLSDGEGWKIRRWATERLEGRDATPQGVESDDDVEKPEAMSSQAMSSPEMTVARVAHRNGVMVRTEVNMRASAPPAVPYPMEAVPPAVEEQSQPRQPREPPPEFVVPTQDTFNFQAPVMYPREDAYLNLANLALSDTQTQTPVSRTLRTRHGNPPRGNSRVGNHLGRGAGQKRRLNLGEIFDLGSLGNGKDPFGSGPKRSRHT